MEISKEQIGKELHLRLKGRLDAAWSDHVQKTIAEHIREGSYCIVLNCAELEYVSSAGIRVLLVFYKQLAQVEGSLRLVEVRPVVRDVLQAVGLSRLMDAGQGETPAAEGEAETVEHGNIEFQVYDRKRIGAAAGVSLKYLGDPQALLGRGKMELRQMAFPEATFGLGLGAFGDKPERCLERVGEFLAVGGTAAYLPPGSERVVDYVTSSGTLVPSVLALYGFLAQGKLDVFVRFRAAKTESVLLSEVIAGLASLVGKEELAVVMVAESAGLVGASLRKSPLTRSNREAIFSYPQIQEFVSFTADKAYRKNLALVAGAAGNAAEKFPFFRPLSPSSPFQGHFHAAVFPYQPFRKDRLVLEEVVGKLFGSENTIDLLHLLHDDREIIGGGESEFSQGIIWFAPVTAKTGMA